MEWGSCGWLPRPCVIGDDVGICPHPGSSALPETRKESAPTRDNVPGGFESRELDLASSETGQRDRKVWVARGWWSDVLNGKKKPRRRKTKLATR